VVPYAIKLFLTSSLCSFGAKCWEHSFTLLLALLISKEVRWRLDYTTYSGPGAVVIPPAVFLFFMVTLIDF
jgi:hypothetical protein